MDAPPGPAPALGERHPPITPDTLHDIVAEHLQRAGMRAVVADMRRQAKAARASARSAGTHRQPAHEHDTTLQSPSVGPSAGALGWCLSSSVATRVAVRHLLGDGASKLHAQFQSMGLPAPDTAFLQNALDSNEKRMWSVQDDVDAVYVGRAGGKAGRGIPAFGTLHQLIEALTHVSVLPLSTLAEERLLAQEEFTHAFLRQHRYFASSSTVLAKLMERFMVPLSLKLGFDNFEAHGISVHAPGTSLSSVLAASRVTHTRSGEAEEAMERGAGHFSPSASLWLGVCRRIQLRVMSVLTLWLREYPRHFDDAMRHSVHLFLDDCASAPQPWSDCASQLRGMMEFARAGVSASAAAAQDKRGGAIAARRHRLCDGPPTLPFPSATRGSAAEENSLMRVQDGVEWSPSLRALPGAGSAARVSC
ncbi:uncharacterized protein Tco025E_04634 [Trypanosoma conorhini]|uniref:N-terminal Ras-GEF domain-containing protein n=1 Tax=Trypanosoma conorhini TaxID=83891 RepID=A0A422PKA5_9TRYP|nr:uncharacterized protein Tco025E_04634 [Trypanosoma conorhini]RNF18131.1 hypothetical protein Tco025E_04634 [Trypanosoma conorhini]